MFTINQETSYNQQKIFSIDSSSQTETDTEVSNDVMSKKNPHQSKRQLNHSSDEETCTDKATIMTSYDHFPPPIVNVAQGSNSLSANEDNWLLNVFNNGRMNRNDTDVISNTSSKQNTSTQQNTSIIHNTSTKPNESFEIDSTYLKDIQCEDDSELFEKVRKFSSQFYSLHPHLFCRQAYIQMDLTYKCILSRVKTNVF